MGLKIVLSTVLLMFVYLICGFTLVKTKKAKTEHAKSLSAMLIYVCSPCMIVNSFLNMEYTRENLIKSGEFFGVTIIIQLLMFFILFLLFRKKYGDARYRIMTAGTILGNVGFFGLPLVTALFPNEPIVGCYSTIFVSSMNILVFTIGVYLITNDKKFISVKSAICNPVIIATAIAIPIYILQPPIPDSVINVVSFLGKMSTPVCMIVLGMRLASMNLKETFSNKFAYIVCGLKLVVFPLFAFWLVKFIPFFDDTFKTCVAVLCASPSAAVVLSLAEMHECEQKLTANTVLISTLGSIITIPLILWAVT